MDWRHLFLDFKGRISRKHFWIGSVPLIVAHLALMWAIFQVAGIPSDALLEPDPRVAGTSIAVSLALMYPSLAVCVKRLHDRGRPGWLIAPLYAVGFLLDLLDLAGLGGTAEENSLLFLVALFVAIALLVWFLIELGLLKGTRGPNRYGPDPLGAPRAGA